MECTYSISKLAREFEITPRTIRYYEAEGLVSPARDGHGFTPRTTGCVLRGKRLGFSLAEAKEIIDL